jgi:predicted ATPase/DNA-binding SARP family transcriptional activator
VNRLEIRTLGPLEVRLDGRTLDLGTRKQRALFALLVANRRNSVSADRIMTVLWGAAAAEERRKDVWVYVSRLRKVLAPADDVLRRNGAGYVLDVQDDAVDAVRFEALVDEGRRLLMTDPPAASLVLGEALAAWSGKAFGEFNTEDFVAPEVARLEESRLQAVEMRIEANLSWEDTDALIPEIEGLVAAHPLRVRLTACLMVALYRRGRQADALHAYRGFAARLGEMGLQPPDELRVLEEQVLLDDPVLEPASRSVPTRLPQRIASFVGRAAELSEVAALLDEHRLVTLTGPGGVGKTALAVEVARRLVLNFDDAAVVDLTRAEQSGDVMAVLAEALRVRIDGPDPTDAMLARLGNRKVLLIVDNCEPVVTQAAEAIATLLEAASGLRVLATSRVVLGIPGDRIVRVAPLSVEPDGDAVKLLGDRIAALPAAARSAVDDDALRALCVKTAGLPLAIELVAAQLRTWPAHEIVAALDDPLQTLVAPERVGPEHHRELRANIAWSERLLPAPAVTLLARLSVFRSSFSFDAAGSVARFDPLDAGSVRQELRRLVDASLVMVQSGRLSRYYLLEPVRHYAGLQLGAAGDADTIAERHARYYVDLFEALSTGIELGTEVGALQRAKPEAENVFAALRWALAAGEVDLAQRGTAAATPFWRQAVSVGEMLPTIDAVLDMSPDPTKALAEVLHRAAPVYGLGRGMAAYRQKVDELQAVAEVLNDPEVSAWAARRMADAAGLDGADLQQVIDMHWAAADSMRQAGSPEVASVLNQLGWYQYWRWDRWEEVEETAAELLRVACSLGEAEEADARHFVAWLALARVDQERLEREAAAAAAGYRRLGNHRMAALVMFPLAIGSLQAGDAAEALRRIDVALIAAREAGAVPWILNALLTRACAKLTHGDHAGAAVDLVTVAGSVADGGEPGPAGAVAAVAARTVAASDPEHAAVLLGAASTHSGDDHMFLVTHRLLAPILDAVSGGPEFGLRGTLGTSGYEAALSRGGAMDVDPTTALVLAALNAAGHSH